MWVPSGARPGTQYLQLHAPRRGPGVLAMPPKCEAQNTKCEGAGLHLSLQPGNEGTEQWGTKQSIMPGIHGQLPLRGMKY